MRGAALGERLELRLDRRAFLCRCAAASFSLQLSLDLVELPAGSGCTATAVSPSIVSGRVVAMVTRVRLARALSLGALGIDHRVVEADQNLPLTSSWNTSSSLTAVWRNVSQFTSRLPR